ncbi:MAG: hypothetical protein V4737_09325, partial [Curtobacterium sp.]
MTNRTSRALFAAAATGAILMALTACTTAQDRTAPAPSTTAEQDKPAVDTAPKPTATEQAAERKTLTSKPITDDVFGHQIQAKEVVRHFPIDPDKQAGYSGSDAEQVLVKIDASAGKEYYSQISCSDLDLL